MHGFRKKLAFGYLSLLIVFLLSLFPFAEWSVIRVIKKTLEDRSQVVIRAIQKAPDLPQLVKRLQNRSDLLFFRVSLFTSDNQLLYDSVSYKDGYFVEGTEIYVHQPEIETALEDGLGYSEDYSKILSLRLVYTAVAFDFHGQTLVLRTSYPYAPIYTLTRDFGIVFLGIGGVMLLLFGGVTWSLTQRLSAPIQQIIDSIRPYQQGREDHIPPIELQKVDKRDEFYRLADTLNSLSERIQMQIQTLTDERNERAAILESLVEGVVAVDSSMVVHYANKAALQLLGREKEDLLGYDFSVAEEPLCRALILRCFQQGDVVKDSFPLARRPKAFFNAVAAPKGKDSGAVLVLQDQSDVYRALEMKKDFIANASHELKTPITVVRGFAETLHDNPDLEEEIVSQITGKIVSSCDRMTNLIKNLLTLSDLEAQVAARVESTEVRDLVENCVATVQGVYPEADFEILEEEGEPIKAMVDSQILELAIINLLNNAAKYSGETAKIRVDISREDQTIQIAVSDEGIGIPEEDLDSIFQRFYTVDKSHSRRLGGAGLGLSLVNIIAEKHGGTVLVNSEMGKGSTFTIVLPDHG